MRACVKLSDDISLYVNILSSCPHGSIFCPEFIKSCYELSVQLEKSVLGFMLSNDISYANELLPALGLVKKLQLI